MWTVEHVGSGVGWLARGMVTRRVETVSDFPSHADDGTYLHVAHSAADIFKI